MLKQPNTKPGKTLLNK